MRCRWGGRRAPCSADPTQHHPLEPAAAGGPGRPGGPGLPEGPGGPGLPGGPAAPGSPAGPALAGALPAPGSPGRPHALKASTATATDKTIEGFTKIPLNSWQKLFLRTAPQSPTVTNRECYRPKMKFGAPINPAFM